MNYFLNIVVLVAMMASATVSGLSLGVGPIKKVAVFGGTGVSSIDFLKCTQYSVIFIQLVSNR